MNVVFSSCCWGRLLLDFSMPCINCMFNCSKKNTTQRRGTIFFFFLFFVFFFFICGSINLHPVVCVWTNKYIKVHIAEPRQLHKKRRAFLRLPHAVIVVDWWAIQSALSVYKSFQSINAGFTTVSVNVCAYRSAIYTRPYTINDRITYNIVELVVVLYSYVCNQN